MYSSQSLRVTTDASAALSDPQVAGLTEDQTGDDMKLAEKRVVSAAKMSAALQRVAAAEALLQAATAEVKELQAALKAASNQRKPLPTQSSNVVAGLQFLPMNVPH